MSFTNPRRPIVLTEHLDFYQWPCISGEPFPPAFVADSGGVVAYSTKTTYPTVRIDQGATVPVTSSRAEWPALPLTSPRTGVFNGYTLTLKFYIQTLQVNNASLVIALDADGNNAILFNKTNAAPNGILPYIGGAHGAGAGACPSLNTWHDLSMTVAADGLSIGFTIDGTLIYTATSGTSIATYPPALTVIATNGGSFAVDAHVSQIEHSWS